MVKHHYFNMINTHHLIISFGKHKGMLWTRVPADYLRWLVNQPDNLPQMKTSKEIARAELDRRGTKVNHSVEISPHAIDRASLRLYRIWQETSNEDEGIYSWLSRITSETLKSIDGKPEQVRMGKIVFVFKWGNHYPVLKTVIYSHKKL